MTKYPEQRQHRRQSPRQLVYLELQPNNGGMILNVSEGGFGFRAVAPVRPNEKIHFAIAFDENLRLEGNGRLEWVDQDRTRAGLQFTEVSEEFGAQIRHWLTKTSVALAEDTQSPDPAARPFAEANMFGQKTLVEPVKERLAPSAVDRSGELEAAQMHAQIPVEQASADVQERAAALEDELVKTHLRSLQQEAERLVTAFQEAGAESERKLVELQETVQTQTNRMKEALRGAGQASQRLEDHTAALEILQQQKLSSFQSQADDLLSRYVSDLHQRSESLLEGINSRTRAPGSSIRWDTATVVIMVAGLVMLLAAVLLGLLIPRP